MMFTVSNVMILSTLLFKSYLLRVVFDAITKSLFMKEKEKIKLILPWIPCCFDGVTTTGDIDCYPNRSCRS